MRSTPGRKNTVSVTSRSRAKNSGVNMSPSFATSAITTPVRAPELVAVREEGLHVLVPERHLLGEAGIDPESGGKPRHRQGDERERREHEAAAGEQKVLGAGG